MPLDDPKNRWIIRIEEYLGALTGTLRGSLRKLPLEDLILLRNRIRNAVAGKNIPADTETLEIV